MRQEVVAQATTDKLGKWQIKKNWRSKASGVIVLSRDSDGRLLCKGNLEFKDKNGPETLKANIYSVGPPTTPYGFWHFFLDKINETRNPLEEEGYLTSELKKAPVFAELQGDFSHSWRGLAQKSNWAELSLRSGDASDLVMLVFPNGEEQKDDFGAIKSPQEDWHAPPYVPLERSP